MVAPSAKSKIRFRAPITLFPFQHTASIYLSGVAAHRGIVDWEKTTA